MLGSFLDMAAKTSQSNRASGSPGERRAEREGLRIALPAGLPAPPVFERSFYTRPLWPSAVQLQFKSRRGNCSQYYRRTESVFNRGKCPTQCRNSTAHFCWRSAHSSPMAYDYDHSGEMALQRDPQIVCVRMCVWAYVWYVFICVSVCVNVRIVCCLCICECDCVCFYRGNTDHFRKVNKLVKFLLPNNSLYAFIFLSNTF